MLDRGFLPPEDPLARLPPPFAAWEDATAELPKLLVAGQARRAIGALPGFPLDALQTGREVDRAMVILSHLASAYVWGEQPLVDRLPALLAVPWHAVGRRLGLPPMTVYAYHALHKWRRFDPAGDIALGNIALTANFWGGIDEEWFSLVHVNIEAVAAPGVRAIAPAQRSAAEGDAAATERHLGLIAAALDAMMRVLGRMTEWCDPYVYYHRVRPFMFGWKNNASLPLGMIYEGVREYGGKPMQFYGETGAQSAIIPAFDALLGIAHEFDDMRAYLMAMRDYMPAPHRAFIAEIERGPALREAVIRSGSPALREAYNGCVQRVEDFRAKHLWYAATYIAKQAAGAQVGTGGTAFQEYLVKHRRETQAHLLR